MTVIVNPNESEAMKCFMEKVKTKLRDNIADSLPPEIMDKMIQQVITEEFFTKTKVKVGNDWNYSWKENPSKFQEMVLTAAKPVIEKIAQDYLEKNQEKLNTLINETISKGFSEIFTACIRQFMADTLSQNSSYIINQIRGNI